MFMNGLEAEHDPQECDVTTGLNNYLRHDLQYGRISRGCCSGKSILHLTSTNGLRIAT